MKENWKMVPIEPLNGDYNLIYKNTYCVAIIKSPFVFYVRELISPRENLDKKQWGDKFESFLIDKHAEQYNGLDDEMPENYNDWLQDLSHDEIIEMIGEFCQRIFSSPPER